ncbi:hypothetical protein BKA59DRAFT_544769 [Fusarium tricinctum]|uniref:Uncharacterized protein n=1 Tax=Fusarium tricinctum TaxID=61284 RepID=A0A8K0RZF8_9HYPO|nr:hypothetical protein BKA59DRAFT_544769 [Fusarium tricinctum]
MASLSNEVFRPHFTVRQPDTLTAAPLYIPETTAKVLSKKMKKKKKDKGAVQVEEYTSTRISQLDDLNNVETSVPASHMMPEPEPAMEPADEPAMEPVSVEEAVPEEEAVPQEQHHFEHGYGYTIRQNDEAAESTINGEPDTTPSPLYLPFSAQHRLMIHLQHKLEALCFSFGQQHIPEKLRAEGWDCPEAVELNVWTAEFRFNRYFRERLPQLAQHNTLLDSITNIRNYAVSRTRIDTAELKNVLASAVQLAIVLGEEGSVFEKLREDVINTNNWLGEETEQLQNTLDAKLTVIAAARAKVDALEEGTRAAFDKRLLKRQNAAHAKVLMAIERADADQPSEVTDRSVAPSSLDWVNGLENSLMLGDDSQEESWT